MKLLGLLAGILMYLEIVYHLGCFGISAISPVLAFTFVLVLAAFGTLIVGCAGGKWKKRVLRIYLVLVITI